MTDVGQEGRLEPPRRLAVVDHQIGLVVDGEAADVHVGRSDRAHHRVHRDGLAVEVRALVEQHADAGLGQIAGVGHAGTIREWALSPARGDHHPDAHARHRHRAEHLQHAVVEDTERRLYVHMIARHRDHGQILLADDAVARVRAGVDDLHRYGAGPTSQRVEGTVGEQLPRGVEPLQRERPLQHRHGVPGHARVRVAPAGESRGAGQVLAREIEAAGVANLAVDDRQLAVIPVADGVEAPRRRVRVDVDARRSQGVHVAPGQHREAADRIVEGAHGHAVRDALAQDVQHLASERIVGPLVVLEVNQMARAPQILEESGILLAGVLEDDQVVAHRERRLGRGPEQLRQPTVDVDVAVGQLMARLLLPLAHPLQFPGKAGPGQLPPQGLSMAEGLRPAADEEVHDGTHARREDHEEQPRERRLR